jgi:hypothetical protein
LHFAVCAPIKPNPLYGTISMESFARALVPIAVAVVAIILLLGLWNMMRGGSASTSQNLMRARVIAQFVAILIIMGALWIMGR